jgi:uncharacterized membrane protein
MKINVFMNLRLPFFASGLFVFSLFACQTPAKMPPAPINLNCTGNEPYWGVKVEPQGITFQLIGEEPVNYPFKAAKTKGSGYIFQSTVNKSRIKIEVFPEDCYDTMSSSRYPYRVKVDKDGKLLQGCAFTKNMNPAQGQ